MINVRLYKGGEASEQAVLSVRTSLRGFETSGDIEGTLCLAWKMAAHKLAEMTYISSIHDNMRSKQLLKEHGIVNDHGNMSTEVANIIKSAIDVENQMHVVGVPLIVIQHD